MADLSTITLPSGDTYNLKDQNAVPSSEKGSANGVATLDANGLIPQSQVPGMVILSYGNNTWDDFLEAYQKNNIIYCRASSNSNPASGSQTRLAFMAYVNNATSPTEVEFQYYRSVSSHSATQQGDQVYVYKLNKNSGWSVTTRETYTRVVTDNGLTSTWSGGVLTASADIVSTTKLNNAATAATEVAGRVYPVALDTNGKLAVNVPWESGGSSLQWTIDNDGSGSTSLQATIQNDVENNIASGNYSHAEGQTTTASGNRSHAEGKNTTASASDSHAEGYQSQALGYQAHAEGYQTVAGVAGASKYGYHAEGNGTIATGEGSHAEGYGTTASANYGSHAEGYGATAVGEGSHAEGYNTVAGDANAVSSPWGGITNGAYAHAEGNGTTASGTASHSEGSTSVASGNNAHAEGAATIASGFCAHAEGDATTASGSYSYSGGFKTSANHKSQHVFGEYNESDSSTAAVTARGNYIEIVGNGTADNARSNARTLDWSGNEVLAGKLTVGTGPTNNMDVATKQYVDGKSVRISSVEYEALTPAEKVSDTTYFVYDESKDAPQGGDYVQANLNDVTTEYSLVEDTTIKKLNHPLYVDGQYIYPPTLASLVKLSDGRTGDGAFVTVGQAVSTITPVKPTYPLQEGSTPIYPKTTVDQVISRDGITPLSEDGIFQDDVLTLEEIEASTDLSGYVASASAVKSIGETFTPVLIWTNSNPTEDFMAQDISISNLSQYNYLIFTFMGHKTYATYDEFIVKCSYPTTWQSVSWIELASSRCIWTRNFRVLSSGTISFQGAVQAKFDTSTTFSMAYDRMIPLHIYGVNTI